MLPQSPHGQVGQGSQANENEFSLISTIPPCSVEESVGPSLQGQESFMEEM